MGDGHLVDVGGRRGPGDGTRKAKAKVQRLLRRLAADVVNGQCARRGTLRNTTEKATRQRAGRGAERV